MHVLIVEDNKLNAFCLRRLLESTIDSIEISFADNSRSAVHFIDNCHPDIVILDGDLGSTDDQLRSNGPKLAEVLLERFPSLPLISWTDSDEMCKEFEISFSKFGQALNEYNCWTKTISLERICKTWAYYFGTFMAEQHPDFLIKYNPKFGS